MSNSMYTGCPVSLSASQVEMMIDKRAWTLFVFPMQVYKNNCPKEAMLVFPCTRAMQERHISKKQIQK